MMKFTRSSKASTLTTIKKYLYTTTIILAIPLSTYDIIQKCNVYKILNKHSQAGMHRYLYVCMYVCSDSL